MTYTKQLAWALFYTMDHFMEDGSIALLFALPVILTAFVIVSAVMFPIVLLIDLSIAFWKNLRINRGNAWH